MADRLDILIKAILDKDDFQKDLDKQVEGLQNLLNKKSLKLKVDIDGIGDINQSLGNMEKQAKKTAKSTSDSFKASTKDLKKYKKELEEAKKELDNIENYKAPNYVQQKKKWNDEIYSNTVFGKMKQYGVKRPTKDDPHYEAYQNLPENIKKGKFWRSQKSGANEVETFLDESGLSSQGYDVDKFYEQLQKGVPKFEEYYDKLKKEEDDYKQSLKERIKFLEKATKEIDEQAIKVEKTTNKWKKLEDTIIMDDSGNQLGRVEKYIDSKGNRNIVKYDQDDNVETETLNLNNSRLDEVHALKERQWNRRMDDIALKSQMKGVGISDELNNLNQQMMKLDSTSDGIDFKNFEDELRTVENQLNENIRKVDELEKAKKKVLNDATKLKDDKYLTGDQFDYLKSNIKNSHNKDSLKNSEDLISNLKKEIELDKKKTKEIEMREDVKDKLHKNEIKREQKITKQLEFEEKVRKMLAENEKKRLDAIEAKRTQIINRLKKEAKSGNIIGGELGGKVKETKNADTIKDLERIGDQVDALATKNKRLKKSQQNVNQTTDQYISQRKRLTQQLVEFSLEGKATSKELDDLQKNIDGINDGMGLAKAKKELKDLKQQYAETGSKVKDLGVEIGNLTGNKQDLQKMNKKEFLSLVKLDGAYKEHMIRGFELNSVSGKWQMTIKENAKEERILGGVIDQTTGKIHKQSDAIRDASAKNLGILEQFKIALGRVPVWMGAMTVFYGSIRSIQAMVQVITEVDTQMTELKRVMNEDTNFNMILEESVGLSKELGNNLQDVQQAITGFARQGFEAYEALAMARTATIASNVSELTADESMEKITALMTQFNITAEESISIVDKLNEVDNSFAITTKDLAQATAKAGATAKTFGVTLDEMIGQVTAIGVATRESGSIIGNSLKTIYSRLTTMEDSKNALKAVGISIHDLNGDVKSGTKILDELHNKWETLTDEQRQHTAVSLAGRYQLSRFLALMNNYEMSLDATETALNSQGSAMEENEAYMQSVQAQINKLNTAWQEFALSVGDAFLKDAFLNVINLLKNTAEVASSVVDAIGLLPPVLGTAGTAFVLMNNSIRDTIFSLGKFKGALATTGVGLAFVALGSAIEFVSNKIAENRRQLEEWNNEKNKIAESIMSNGDEVEKLMFHYEGLRERLEQYKLANKDTANVEKEMLEVKSKLAKMMPNFVESVDAEGNSRLKSIELMKEELEWSKAVAKQKQQETINNSVEKFNSEIADREEKLKKIRSLESELATLEFFGKNSQSEEQKRLHDEKIARVKHDMRDLELQVSRTTKNIESEAKNLSRTFLMVWDNVKFDESLKNNLDVIFDSIEGFTNMGAEEIKDFSQTVAIELEKLQKSPESIDEVTNSLKTLFKGIPNGDEIIQNLIKTVEEHNEKIEEGSSQVEFLDDSIQDLGTTVDEAIDSISTINGYLEEYKENNNLSAESILEIVEKYPTLLGLMNDEKALIEALKQKKIEEEKVAKEALAEKLIANQEFFNENIRGNKELIDDLNKFYGTDLENFKSLADAKVQVESKLQSALASSWAGYYDEQKGLTSAGADFLEKFGGTEMGKEFSDQMIKLENLNSKMSEKFKDVALKTISLDLSNIGSSKEKKKKEKKGDKPDHRDAIDAFIRENQLSEQALEKSNQKLQNQIKESERQVEFNKQLELTNSLLDSQNERVEKLISANENLHNKANEIRKSTKFTTENWFDKNGDATQSYVEEYNNASKTQQENMEKVFIRLQKLKNQYMENQSEVFNLKEAIKELNLEYIDTKMNQYSYNIESVNNSISKQDKILQNLDSSSTNYTVAIKEQNRHYEHKKSLIKEQIKYLEKLVKTDKSYQMQLSNTRLELMDVNNAIVSNMNKMRQQREELANTIIELMKSAYRKQEQVAMDAIDKELDMLEEAHSKKMKMLDEEIDKYRETINEKIKLIDRQSEDQNFESELGELQNERLKIQGRLDSIGLDNSIESQSRKIELEQELSEVTLDIESLKDERVRDLRKRNLKDKLDNKEQEIKTERESLKYSVRIHDEANGKIIDIKNKTYEVTKRLIEKERKDWQRSYQNLIQDETAYNQTREEIVEGSMDDVSKSFETFIQFLKDHSSILGESLTYNLINKLYEAQEALFYLNQQMANIQYPSQEPSDYFNGGVEWNASNLGKIETKHSGGIVGDEKPSKLNSILNDFFNVKPNERIIKALKNELMIPQENIHRNFIPNVKSLINSANIPSGSTNMVKNNNYNLNVKIDSMNGNKKDANYVVSEIVKGIKKLGGDI